MYNKLLFVERAFDSRMQTLSIINKVHIDINEFFSDVFILFNDIVGSILILQHVLKVGSCLTLEFQEENNSNMKFHITTPLEIIDSDTDFKEWYKDNILNECLRKIEDFEVNGSGWSFHSISDIQIFTNQHDF